jgi:hypothetical protein
MGVLSGYVALINCSLCLISLEGGVREGAVTRGRRKVSSINVREEGLVTVLSVEELSTPVRSVYDSGKQHLLTRILYHSALLLNFFGIIYIPTAYPSSFHTFSDDIPLQTIAGAHLLSHPISDVRRGS